MLRNDEDTRAFRAGYELAEMPRHGSGVMADQNPVRLGRLCQDIWVWHAPKPCFGGCAKIDRRLLPNQPGDDRVSQVRVRLEADLHRVAARCLRAFASLP